MNLEPLALVQMYATLHFYHCILTQQVSARRPQHYTLAVDSGYSSSYSLMLIVKIGYYVQT
jgi:hypothetical protein